MALPCVLSCVLCCALTCLPAAGTADHPGQPPQQSWQDQGALLPLQLLLACAPVQQLGMTMLGRALFSCSCYFVLACLHALE